ncbi:MULTISPECIES: NAD-dependent epimerase [Aneurinibacillus]|uniref:NAD-dependent epimerase n=1 Tax=Aneurinibacillus thermoaerophilus TaxID=143495 RepID=A0A1G7ZXW7_ANETH|nr:MULTISPECIES: NAD-dependent epimerase [Aneurinibacillus]AMA71686.1 hypothetical protein ACH33_01750 [Aneurinibacillus sp. XH2]MED0680764.1 NAD-dependent epimerase [Aneurinibacillus thermoaerophilus]MED0738401.1 NAD-dependent epimerase [Aneurinibacillus thermoaerophilus]MED0757673.1 NAD-dependent epimerase [Aneurinibacillus thermoaerophilus]MED0759312.1 NAD-dependent epimerase [Aneurinibacillus thermoaerophilus]
MGTKETILVTGCAGFIGFHVVKRLLHEGYPVVGLDNLNDYYDVSLKQARLAQLIGQPHFTFVRAALEDRQAIEDLFSAYRIEIVIHLAAQAGVRHSLQNPYVYADSNLTGFVNMLEACRHHRVKHLLYASSSSVYGANGKQPFSEHDDVNHPVSLYAATKKANELMAHTYSHLYGLATTGVRLFTVYGPWGRPDMAYFSFTRAILAGETIKIFNRGNMKRDFTYIDDAVEAIVRLMSCVSVPNPAWRTEAPDPASSYAPYRIYNIGSQRPVSLLEFIKTLEQVLGREAKKEWLPLQPGDVKDTYADVQELIRATGYRPQTPLADGLHRFAAWYRKYYRV